MSGGVTGAPDQPPIRITLVVAASENGVIGRAGGLPWRHSGDLKLFRRLTLDKPVVMGRKTFQSIGKPLDRRDNIVVTRDPAFRAPGVIRAASLDAALALAREHALRRGADEIAIIGGGEIYRAALPVADRIYLTRIHVDVDGDTRLPALGPEWRETSREPVAPGVNDALTATLHVLDRVTA